MINFTAPVGAQILELGGGENPIQCATCNMDVRQMPSVQIVHDLQRLPWPLQNSEWDAVVARYVLEHVGWRLIPDVLLEIHRVLKSGGKIALVLPNTEAQLHWILANQDGWDSRDLFGSAGGLLFGDQTYDANAHKAYLSPTVVTKLLVDAGFANVVTVAAGARNTDMCVEAVKVEASPVTAPELKEEFKAAAEIEAQTPITVGAAASAGLAPLSTTEERQSAFDGKYFGGGGKWGGYAHDGLADFQCHHLTVQYVLNRKPTSVLEIGAARGYLGKKFEDSGLKYRGLEISRHCYLTRVSENVIQHDTCLGNWPAADKEFDLAFSIAVMEHIPEQFLPVVIGEMARTCTRGLMAIDLGADDDGFDRTHVTLRSREWWYSKFAEQAPGWPVEVVDKEELEAIPPGGYPKSVLEGDGKVKVNVGSFTTMMPHGWINFDMADLQGWAAQHGYKYLRGDVRSGLPFQTSSVDLLFCVKPGALVRTKKGMHPIEEIRIGDEVLTHLGRWKKVTRTFVRQVADEKMVEFRGACLPFFLTGNHSVYVKRHWKDVYRVNHHESGWQWVPSDLVETNNNVLIPLPPLKTPLDRYDLALHVDQSGSEVVHQVVAARASGSTYKTIREGFGITQMQVRKWTKEGGAPRGATLVGDETIRQGNSKISLPRWVKMGEEFGRYLGYLLSDGSADGVQVAFYFGLDQTEYVEDVDRLSRSLFGIPRSASSGGISSNGNTLNVVFCCSALSKILKKIVRHLGKPGRKALQTRMLSRGNPDFFKGLVIGLWRGDGTVGKTGASYSTVDVRLAHQVQEVLARLNIASRIGKVAWVPSHGGFGSEGQIRYSVHVSGESFRELALILNKTVVPSAHQKRSRSFVRSDGIETPVKIKEERYTGPVYNIEVEEDHSYTLNGVAVHNCHHALEHLTYVEGRSFLRDCRRVLKHDGAFRVAVPNAGILMKNYNDDNLGQYDDLNEGCAKSNTAIAKLHALLWEGHAATYDSTTLLKLLTEVGFTCRQARFRAPAFSEHAGLMQILKETQEMEYGGFSLFVDAIIG